MKAKISIIVPVYNVEDYLTKCLDSLVCQTYKDIKIICVNDGSTDGSGKILSDYAKKDKRISVINKKNGGLSSARNAGLKECNTEYVLFCDSDDFFDKDMCKEMLYTIEHDNSDVAVCVQNVVYIAHEEMKKSDDKYYKLHYSGKKIINDDVILNTDVSVLNKIFRMKIIKDNKIEFPEGLNNEDFYFYNVYMSVSSTISFVRKPLYNYLRRDNSIMSNNFKAGTLSIDHLKIAEKLFIFYKKTGYLEKHTDLFWKQWLLSYWFSYEYTSLDLRKKVYNEAKIFVNNNLDKYPPKDVKVKRGVEIIFKNKLLTLPKRAMKKIFGGAYKKVNIGYRQQRYINYNIERLQKRYEELSERLDEIVKEQNV